MRRPNGSEDMPAARRGRSPEYPIFGLATAVQKARMFDRVFRRHPAARDDALGAMDYGVSGSGIRAIAALLHFGIFQEEGRSDARTFQLSPLGLVLTGLPEDDLEHLAARRHAARNPRIYGAMLDRWPED